MKCNGAAGISVRDAEFLALDTLKREEGQTSQGQERDGESARFVVIVLKVLQ